MKKRRGARWKLALGLPAAGVFVLILVPPGHIRGLVADIYQTTQMADSANTTTYAKNTFVDCRNCLAGRVEARKGADWLFAPAGQGATATSLPFELELVPVRSGNLKSFPVEGRTIEVEVESGDERFAALPTATGGTLDLSSTGTFYNAPCWQLRTRERSPRVFERSGCAPWDALDYEVHDSYCTLSDANVGGIGAALFPTALLTRHVAFSAGAHKLTTPRKRVYLCAQTCSGTAEPCIAEATFAWHDTSSQRMSFPPGNGRKACAILTKAGSVYGLMTSEDGSCMFDEDARQLGVPAANIAARYVGVDHGTRKGTATLAEVLSGAARPLLIGATNGGRSRHYQCSIPGRATAGSGVVVVTSTAGTVGAGQCQTRTESSSEFVISTFVE